MTEYGFGRRTFLLAGGACLAGGLGAAGPAPVRQTTAGQVSGCATMQPGVTAWLGIPYAAPPVGNLRWKPPHPVTPWAGVRSCTQFGGSPWAPSGPMESFTPSHMDEDCLNLNVWAPPSDGRLRPVMVWIYGGAFIMGSSQDPKYDGARLAADGVVFVSVNYRVGILGSFAHPELAQESPHGVSGNYGLMDQVAALQWVRDNIARFDGDPDNVTIFGQSAGAFSVAYHLVMPASRGLFHRAVAQSGAPLGKPSSYILLGNTKQMEQVGAAYAQSLKAPSLEALRRIPAKDLIKSYGFNWLFYPAVDGWLVPRSPYSMMAEGDCARVPVMAGHNHDEGSLFPPMGGGTQTGIQSAVSDFYGQQRDPLLQVLCQEGYNTPAAMGHQIFGDVVFNWNTIVLSQVMSRHVPSYAYRFDYAHTKPVNPHPAPGQLADAGAFHGAEIGFVLKTHQYEEPARRSEQEHLMQVVSGYWLNFAKTGSPNGSGLTHWPVYQPAKRQLFSLDAHAQGLSNIDHYDRLVLLGQAMNNRVLEEEG